MARKLTILFAPLEAVGHVNACIGLAEVLLSRGHKIVFAIDQSFEGRLAPFGFTEEILITDESGRKKPGETMAKELLNSGRISNVSSTESMKTAQKSAAGDMFAKKRVIEPMLRAIVAKHNPDVSVVSEFSPSPTLIYSNKPWVFVYSQNPLMAMPDDNLPPGATGFAVNGDRSEWKALKEKMQQMMINNRNVKYNEFIKEQGFDQRVDKALPDSPYLNIYGFPEELDYTDIRPIPEKWLRVDTFM
ncbi:unnamed protein product, partial [Medioppia subpectinata]